MLRRFGRSVALAAVLVVLGMTTSHAQYYYPPGYGGYGWNGFSGGTTAYGDMARGMGAFAAGAGVYNQQTAVATSINADTAMRWNEYLWESQQNVNRINAQRMAAARARTIETGDAIQKRLRDNPSDADIMRGDALNVALDEITSPKVYVKALSGAKAKFAGVKIREIPFNYASEALTVSVDDLTKNGPPADLKEPEFHDDAVALKAIGAKIRAQAAEQKPIDPALVQQAQTIIKSMNRTLTSNPAKFKKEHPRTREAANYLKGLYGLLSMLETPAIDVLLSGVEKRPDTTVADLLGFMHSFNLRFGVAKTPEQRAVYAELYPILDKLRREVSAGQIPASAVAKSGASAHPGEFFSGMEYDHLDAKRGVTPPPPAPKR